MDKISWANQMGVAHYNTTKNIEEILSSKRADTKDERRNSTNHTGKMPSCEVEISVDGLDLSRSLLEQMKNMDSTESMFPRAVDLDATGSSMKGI